MAATQAPARPPTAAGGGRRGGARLPLERWTRAVIRFRWLVLSVWLAVALAGGWSLTRLSSVLSNSFAVPGSDSERARTILQDHFGNRSDGSFTVVFRVPQGVDSAVVRRLQVRVDRAARVVPTGSPTALRVASPTLVYGDVVSALTLAKAKPYAATLLRALGQIPGVTTYVTGGAAIEAAVDPILSGDLARSEAIAVPIAFAILVAVLGLSLAITVPFIFAAATITATLGLVFLIAHEVSTATYVTNLVQGIGLGIAVDYSLLIVYRFREELAAG
ncbi:MAG TPA: MMPL family transporter, partial [Gaiellaceae bacterium]|nr:MMPL family transporter [Gaiellaceae bacterium]